MKASKRSYYLADSEYTVIPFLPIIIYRDLSRKVIFMLRAIPNKSESGPLFSAGFPFYWGKKGQISTDLKSAPKKRRV